MEQPQGEFEQRPEVKPADEIPFSKPKASKTPWILCAILLIIVLGLGGFLLYDKVLSKKDDGNKGGSSQTADKPEEKPEDKLEEKPEEKKPAPTDEQISVRINEIFDAVKVKMKEARINVDGYSAAFGPYIMNFVLKEGYVTSFDKPSLYFYSKTNLSDTDKIAARAAFAEVLKKEGFSDPITLKAMTGLGSEDEYYSDEDGYICEYSHYDSYLQCAHSSWISDEKKEATIKMISQYRKKFGEKDTYLHYFDDKIENSPTEPYQTLTANVIDGYVVFYRKGVDSDWTYVTSGNGIPFCEEFQQTEDMRKAFEGTTYLNKGCR